MKGSHIVIQKAKIKAYTDSKKSAYDLKDNASDFLKNVVFQIIEDYFTKYEINNELREKMTVFHRLKLNITINDRDYKSHISGLSVEQEIQKQLDVIFHSSSLNKSSIELNADAENKISYSEADILQNSFIYFLEKGMLPWYCNEELRKRLFTEESIEILFSENQFIDRFLDICRNKTTRRRFASQLNYETVLKALNKLFYHRKLKSDLTNGFRVFEHILFSAVSRKDKTYILSNLLGLWYLSNSEEKIQQMLNGIEKLVLVKDQQAIDKLIVLFKSEDFLQKPEWLNFTGVVNEKQLPFDQMIILEKNETDLIHETADEFSVNDEILKDSITENLEVIIINEDQKEKADLSNEILKEITKELPKQLNKQSMANVGLIIVYPFLETFFGRLGLLSETSKLNDPELCVHLLHYLITGVEQDYEYQLSFEKLLCGIPHEVPIERFVFLTEEMKQEAEGLLQAVLENWYILRNSGIELLRNEFLKREGLIHTDEKNIHISFERKTQDILIDKLEWTLSYIKLKWLDKVIRVNW